MGWDWDRDTVTCTAFQAHAGPRNFRGQDPDPDPDPMSQDDDMDMDEQFGPGLQGKFKADMYRHSRSCSIVCMEREAGSGSETAWTGQTLADVRLVWSGLI